jgi:hypothetical protein
MWAGVSSSTPLPASNLLGLGPRDRNHLSRICNQALQPTLMRKRRLTAAD